ncbi:MAG TPA: hypothetical protein VL096_11940 [Pirellulaceae bacterium]|nr:hypothetical protein [Pirellulaceae bacterium]
MPPKSSNDIEIPTQKQRFNIYTMMLVLSFIAICTACTLLYLELNSYGTFPYWNAASAKFVAPN